MPKQYKIACLGCSWTEGTGVFPIHVYRKVQKTINYKMSREHELAQTDTYPFKLQEFLKAHGKSTEMIQAGRAGSSFEYCHLVANYILKEYNPDIFVIQITTHDRGMLALDPKDPNEKDIKFGVDTFLDLKNNNSYHKIWQLSDNIINISSGLGATASSHNDSNEYTDLLDKIYNEKIKDKMAPEVSFNDFKNYIALWWDQTRNTDFQKYFYYSHVYSLVDYLQEQEKIVIPFYWLKYKPWFGSNLFSERQYPSIQGMMGKKLFESYVIDKGFHFGPDGNAKLIEDFLGPAILETM